MSHSPSIEQKLQSLFADLTSSRAEYIRTRAQDDAHYEKLIIDYLAKFGSASREEVDQLLKGKLSDGLSDDQKSNKVHNLLSGLRKKGRIVNRGSRRVPSWELIPEKRKSEIPSDLSNK